MQNIYKPNPRTVFRNLNIIFWQILIHYKISCLSENMRKLTSCSNLTKLLVIFFITKIDSTLSELEKLDNCKSNENSENCQVITKTQKLFSEISYETGPDLIKQNGFPLEVYNVTSRDGYIINLYRIPNGRFPKSDNQTTKKRVALFHHGFLEDGFEWILNSADKAFAYRLVDELDFDVWLINNRGTYFSLGHTHLSWKDSAYWDFSFHEIGLYDTPIIIDFVLKKTGQSDLYYIAHSMGAAAFCSAISIHPEYNSKIKTAIFLAPAVFVGNTEGPFKPLRDVIFSTQGIHHSAILGPFVSPEIIPYMNIARKICSPEIISKYVCYSALESIFGYDFSESAYDLREEIISLGLSSTSTKTLFHLLQLWQSGKFQWYDYQDKNIEIYGKRDPPEYDLSKITTEVVLYCGNEDNLVPCKDVEKLAQSLPNVKEFHRVNWPQFNHIDFLYSTNINELLHNRLIEILKNT